MGTWLILMLKADQSRRSLQMGSTPSMTSTGTQPFRMLSSALLDQPSPALQ